jgi:succinyl-diaminopimelate desuccinylase
LTEEERTIAGNVDERSMIDFLRELVRSNSENPPGNEKESARLIADKLKECGCEVELQVVEDGRPNVIGVIEGDAPDKILFNGHTDTVKVGNTKEWTVDPLGGDIRDGYLYGRGSSDMKAGLVSMIYAMKALRDSGCPFRRGIMFTGVIDEEVFFKGTGALIRENKLKDCRVGYVSEPTGLEIVIRQKGGIEYTARTFGKYAHSGQAFLGENAIFRMGKLLHALEGYNEDLKHRMDLPKLRYPTVNVGTIRGGTGVTFVPDLCQIEFDRQVFPGESIGQVEAEVNEVIDNVKRENRIEVELVKSQHFNAWEIAEDEPVVKTVERSFEKLFRRKPVYGGLNGYCEVELLAGIGIPSVVFGPGDDTRAHAPDERVAVQEVIDAARVYALLAYEFVSAHDNS